MRDPRTPSYARLTEGLVVAYGLSPIDLIPDFVPISGYPGDAIVIPFGMLFVRQMMPTAVLDDG